MQTLTSKVVRKNIFVHIECMQNFKLPMQGSHFAVFQKQVLIALTITNQILSPGNLNLGTSKHSE